MDASKITELLQKQNTRYINRSKTVDSSTMIWMNQIQSSKYIKGVATCTGLQNTDVPTQAIISDGNGSCSYGGQGKQMSLSTGSAQKYPSVFAGAVGSASQTYTSDAILLQKAGRHYCAELISEQDPYTVLPTCYDVNTNGPTKVNTEPSTNNNQTNPYLPAFDTYYKFKNKITNTPIRDQNLKRFVTKCHSRFPGVPCNDAYTCDGCVLETNIPTKYGWPIIIVGNDVNSTSFSTSLSEDALNVYVTGLFSGTINLYNGGITDTVNIMPVISLTSGSNVSAFVAAYSRTGKLTWATTIQTETGTYTEGFSIAIDSTGVYVLGTFDGTIEFYNSITHGVASPMPGDGVKTLTTQTYGMFVAKYNIYGTFQWVSLLDNAGASSIGKADTSALCIYDSYLYVVSYFYSVTNIYNRDGSLHITLTEQSGISSGALIQYSTSGDINWVTQLNATLPSSAVTYGTGIVANSNGVYITGFINTAGSGNTFNYYTTTSTSTPPSVAGSLSIPNGNVYAVYIMNYAVTGGAPQWITTFDSSDSSSGQMFATGLSLDNYSLYYIGTYVNDLHIYSASPSGPLTSHSHVTLANTNNPGNQNISIVKMRINDGSLLWATTLMDNQGGLDGFGITSDGGNVYVSGSMTNPMNIYTVNNTTNYPQSPNSNPTVTLNLVGGDTEDSFIVKYDIDGNYQWMTIIGGGGSNNASYGIYSDGSAVTVTGAGAQLLNFYNATRTTQPNTIGASFDPSSITTPYAYIMEYNANDGTVVKLK